jgi:hypothetical protein
VEREPLRTKRSDDQKLEIYDSRPRLLNEIQEMRKSYLQEKWHSGKLPAGILAVKEKTV